MQDRRIEAVAVPDDELHAARARRSNDRAAFLERQRHRLFQKDVLIERRGKAGVGGMELVRRRDVDDVHFRLCRELFNAIKSLGTELGRELCAGRGARVGAGDKRHARVQGEGRHHEREGAPQARDTNFEFWYHREYLGG
jgi:hypothetical protein